MDAHEFFEWVVTVFLSISLFVILIAACFHLAVDISNTFKGSSEPEQTVTCTCCQCKD